MGAGDGLAGRVGAPSEEIEALYDGWVDYDADVGSWGYEVPRRVAESVTTGGLLAAGLGQSGSSPAPEDLEVLDAGCGTGLVGEAIAAVSPVTLVGLDISAASLERAATRGVYASLAVGSLDDPLPFADDRFAAVVCAGVLSYVVDVAATIEELVRVAGPGGRVVLTHRSDLWDEQRLDDVLARIEGPAALTVSVSEPLPYLPGHTEFGDDIGVRHVTIDLPAAPAPPGAP